MNKITTPDSETILDDDAVELYELISECIGVELDLKSDVISLNFSKESSQNARKELLIECTINNEFRVGMKRCMDNPEYRRREILTDNVKKITDFPSYTILEQNGIRLRVKDEKKQNCKILQEWENKIFLVINFGKIADFVKIKDLSPKGIPLEEFCIKFGRWAAFNYLLGVIDRHEKNFLYSFSQNEIHSIDNELGPIAKGNLVGYRQVVKRPRQTIQKFVDHGDRETCILYLQEGFKEGWDKVVSHLSKILIFNDEENKLLEEKSESDRDEMAGKFFY